MLTLPKPFDFKVLYNVGIKEAACWPFEFMEEYDVLLVLFRLKSHSGEEELLRNLRVVWLI